MITGPTGAIGTALIRECIAHGTEVTAVCHRETERIQQLPVSDRVRVIRCNLDELKFLPEMTEDTGYDVFFHLGWSGTFGSSRDDMKAQAENIRYTLEAVEAARDLGCSRFIGAGSQAEYGRKEEKLAADTPACPETGYGMAKLCAGQMSRCLCEQLGLIHIWTRILSVYGPGDGKGTMVMSVIDQLLRGEKPALTGGGQIWDYLYSQDAGRAFYLLGEKGIHGKTYPVGSGSCRSLSRYVRIIRDSIDPKLALGFGEVEYSLKQVMYLCADISELKKDTGFEPIYSFEEGIRRTIDWYRNSTGEVFAEATDKGKSDEKNQCDDSML